MSLCKAKIDSLGSSV